MPEVQESTQALVELVQLLHTGAPAEEFARWQAGIEARPLPDKALLLDAGEVAMAVRTRIELLEQRERGLLALNDSARSLTSRLHLDELLGAIVSRARNLLGADLAWLSAHDPESGEFHVLVADGALSQRVSRMVARRDSGVASIVMSTKLPFVTPDYLHDTRFPHDATLDDVFREEGVAAFVGVPLIWEGEVIGLLFVADRYSRVHPAQSVAILCTLATHGAVALKNARHVERLNAAIARGDEARAELERHLRGIQAAAEAHEQMTALLVQGASLSVLCQSIARWFGGVLLVLDEAGQVISRGVGAEQAEAGMPAYEPQGEHAVEVARALRQSRQTGRSVVAFKVAGKTCRVMAVVGGGDALGSTLLFHEGDIDDVAVRIFERGSSVVGIVLLSQERAEAAKHRGVSALLRSLVAPRQDDPALLADLAERQGLSLSQPLSLMLVQLDGPSATYGARALRVRAPCAGALIDEVDGLLLVLCGTTQAQDVRQAVGSWARREARATFRGVVSRPIASPTEIPALHATLRRAVAVLGRLGVQGHIVGQNELALYSTLFETHDQSSLADYLESIIGPVLEQDRKRGTELAATLLSYFDVNQNATTTAQKLGIHVNTVRQRLATIENLLGHWGQASRALEIHIALRLWHLSAPAVPEDRGGLDG